MFSHLSQQFLARKSCNVDQTVCWYSSLATQEQDFLYPQFNLVHCSVSFNPLGFFSLNPSLHMFLLLIFYLRAHTTSFFHPYALVFVSDNFPFKKRAIVSIQCISKLRSKISLSLVIITSWVWITVAGVISLTWGASFLNLTWIQCQLFFWMSCLQAILGQLQSEWKISNWSQIEISR